MCVNGSGDGKELEKCREFFFSVPFHEIDYLFIFTNCNPTLNCNEQYKEEIGHYDNTLWKSNHSKSEHNINQNQKYRF